MTIPSLNRSKALKGKRSSLPANSPFDDLMPRSWSGRQEHPFRNESRSRVNVIIQGRRSHDYVMRHKGSKFLAAEKLIRQGVPISIISEPEFFNLVWQTRPQSRQDQRVRFAAIHRA